ncbi:hypothetical protein PANDA_020598 [Ailuropoda melanoleuca]|uniref:Uncharacterized protein n=1 Tax=Ailuropoda melanoleuca TaxID=9646 RepID=D2I4Q3_AILME|nr:hypothetical protein PANDA_020598 [Ailuropoda melanoleuca]
MPSSLICRYKMMEPFNIEVISDTDSRRELGNKLSLEGGTRLNVTVKRLHVPRSIILSAGLMEKLILMNVCYVFKIIRPSQTQSGCGQFLDAVGRNECSSKAEAPKVKAAERGSHRMYHDLWRRREVARASELQGPRRVGKARLLEPQCAEVLSRMDLSVSTQNTEELTPPPSNPDPLTV